jgi:hypothetical protein
MNEARADGEGRQEEEGDEPQANCAWNNASGSMLIARRLALPDSGTSTRRDRRRNGTLLHAAAITITPVGASVST